MTLKELKYALEPYGTIKNPNSNKVKSTGLGLSIVKSLTKKLSIDFSIKSQKDKGTTIELGYLI